MTTAVPVPAPAITADAVDAVLGDSASSVAAVRTFRPLTVAHTQGAYRALFEPAEAGLLTVPVRRAIALRIAVLGDQPDLAAHYRKGLPADLEEFADPAAAEPAAADLLAVRRHVDLLATAPATAGRESLQALTDAGLSTDDTVTLAQLIGFVSFQLRVVAGLGLIGASR